MGRPPKWTPAQKAEALTLYGMFGLAETAKRTGIPEATIRLWAKAAGLVAPQLSREERIVARAAASANAETQEANHARALAQVEDAAMTLAAKRKVKRELIRHDLLERIHDALTRMNEAHLEFFPTKDQVFERTYPKAPANAFKAYASAFAILFKEYRLEVGEATDRPEMTQRILDEVKGDHERELLKNVLDMVLNEASETGVAQEEAKG